MAYEVALERKRMIKQLSGLGKALGAKGMRSALVGYAGPIKKEIKNRIRSVTGDLKKSIGHRSFTKTEKKRLGHSADKAIIAVGATRKVKDSRTGKKYAMGYKLHWLDQGVESHDILPRGLQTDKRKSKKAGEKVLRKGKKALKIGSKFVTIARHKGFRGRRILDKSLSASAAASRQGFDKALARFLDKHA